jgi:hypothetical protein
MNNDVPLFFPSTMFQACEIPRRENQRGRGAGILGLEVINHHCGGAVGPMYRKPHLEASRRIARARKKYMMRSAPRIATTTKTTLSSVTSAILADVWSPKMKSRPVHAAVLLRTSVLICANDLGFVGVMGIWDIAESVSCVFSISA